MYRQSIGGNGDDVFSAAPDAGRRWAKTERLIFHGALSLLVLSVVVFAAWRSSGQTAAAAGLSASVSRGDGVARSLIGPFLKSMTTASLGSVRRHHLQARPPCPDGHNQVDDNDDDREKAVSAGLDLCSSGSCACCTWKDGAGRGCLVAYSSAVGAPELAVATLALSSLLTVALMFLTAPRAVPCSRWNVRVDVIRPPPARHHDDASSPFDISDLVIVTGRLYRPCRHAVLFEGTDYIKRFILSQSTAASPFSRCHCQLLRSHSQHDWIRPYLGARAKGGSLRPGVLKGEIDHSL